MLQAVFVQQLGSQYISQSIVTFIPYFNSVVYFWCNVIISTCLKCSLNIHGWAIQTWTASPSDEGSMVIQNIRTYSVSDTQSYLILLESSRDSLGWYCCNSHYIIPVKVNPKDIFSFRRPVLILCSLWGLLQASWCWDSLCMAGSSNWEVKKELLDFGREVMVQESKESMCRSQASGDTMRWVSVTCYGISRSETEWLSAYAWNGTPVIQNGKIQIVVFTVPW
jgi:hypothetical protein